MLKTNMIKEICILLIVTTLVKKTVPALVGQSDIPKCSYGDRGSLTATCINAYPNYFRSTTYRFDQLDETVLCLNCTLTTIDTGNFDISGNQIRNLWLNNSRIERISPKGFMGLIFLERLYLSYNKIKSIVPTTFSGVKKIKYIDLSHNEIELLVNDGFLELHSLEELNLESNLIQTISVSAFNGLTIIKTINLRDNRIRDVNGVFGNMTSLNILNLQYNRITTLKGDEFLNLTGLMELNLANNNLKDVVLELEPNNVLKNLYLQNNIIEVLAAKFLKGLHNLENLDLSNNLIFDISIRTWEKLFQLRRLNVSYNHIGLLQTGTFAGLPQLELLNCSHNNITEIKITGVFSLHSLHALDVSYNQLIDFDYVGLISRLPRLSFLNLEDNKLPCPLEDEMARYFEEDNFKYILYNEKVGSFKCVDVPTKSSLKNITEPLIATAEYMPSRISGAEVTIIVLMCVVFVCIGFLFYMQYRTYQDMYSNRPSRAVSSARLVSSEIDNGDDSYLQG
ncbi:toll-like receptor 4 isoform X1 [Diorhabda sublineata]|uniref:toll-like receptor 4 isoform X1 n=1 Tax=Diorhabda sublineata TaxID=1163346 RepID=UPI0024E0E139|nr:toll-like receptor 4 isoform X1 [Diorhabda sublineata]